MANLFRDGRDPITREPLGPPYEKTSAGEGRHRWSGMT